MAASEAEEHGGSRHTQSISEKKPCRTCTDFKSWARGQGASLPQKKVKYQLKSPYKKLDASNEMK